MASKEIRFYGLNNEWAFLSNMYPCQITLKNPFNKEQPIIFGSSEHVYMAWKFLGNQEHFEYIRNAPNAYEARKLGRMKDIPGFTPEWDKRRLSVMYMALVAKFLQNKDIRLKLVKTGTARLIEDSPWDGFWGIARDKGGNGENRLGRLLEQVREGFMDLYYNPQ